VSSELRTALTAPGEFHVTDDPVRHIRGETGMEPAVGTALCLSGGGYRAMMFHVGVLWRLNEAVRRSDAV
jgi:NTE family protein